MAEEQLILQLRARGVTLTKNQLKKLDASAKKAGTSMKGLIGAVGGVYALGKAFSFVAGVGKEFTSAQSNLAAILGTTSDKLGALDKTAKELGRTTKFTAGEVVSLQTEFAKLGFTTTQIENAQKATLALASATNVDLATAATVAGQTVNAFGLGAEQTQRAVDTMALSFSSSALDMEKFSNSMTYVSAVANQSGISVEATTGLLGKLADVGIDSSVAGTQLRSIFLKMADASSDLTKKIGFQVKSDEDLFRALKILNKEGMDTTEMMALTDKRSVAAFANIVKMADGAEILTESLRKAGGTAEEMAEEQLNNLEGDMLKLKSATEGVALELFEGLEPILRGVVQTFTDFMASLDMETLKSYATSIGIVTAAWVLYTAKQKMATLATMNFKKTLLRTGVGALVVGLGYAIEKMGFFGDATDETTEALNDESKALMSSVTMFAAYGKDKDKQLEIITKLKEEYPEYYGHIDSETASVKELKEATDMYLKVEMQKIVLKQFEAERVELIEKQAAGLKKVIEAQASSAEGLQHYNNLLGLGIREYGNLDEVTGAWTNFNVAMSTIGGNMWAHKELFHTTFGEMFEGYNQNGDKMVSSQKEWLDMIVKNYAVALGVMDKETGKQLEGYDEFISSISDKTPRELASLFGGEDNIQEMGQDTVYVWRKLRDANKEYQEVLSQTTPDVERLAEAEKDLMAQLEKLQAQLFKTDTVVPGQNGDDGTSDDPPIKVLTQEEIDANLAKIAEYNESEMEITREYQNQKLEQERDAQLALAEETIKNSTDLEEAKKQIRETYAKKNAKLDKAEEKASKAKTDAIIGHSVQLINTITGVWKASGKNIEMTANLQYIAAIADTYKAASAAFAKGGGVPGGILPMTVSIAQGMAQVAQIAKARDDAKAAASQSVTAEYGANFVTDGLTNLTVGDNPGGQELVNVTPLSSPNMFGDPDAVGGGQNITVNVSGNVLTKDYVEDELMEAIRESVRRGDSI